MGAQGLTVQIRGLGASGDGVGTLPDGRAVFVPRTAVGETVRISIETERKRWARGRLVEVVTASPARRNAPCSVYDLCGGCQLQHLTYDAQLAAKGTRITDALSRIGGVQTDAVRVLPSPHPLGYRSRLRFHLHRGRAGVVTAGFHRHSRPGTLVDIEDQCLIVDQPLQAAWQGLRRGWGAEAHLLPRGPSLELLLRSVTGGIGLTVIGGSRWREAEALLEAVPEVDALWWQPEGDQAIQWIGGSETLTEVWNSEELELGASGFLQANKEAATTLWDLLVREVGPPGGKSIVDAYCGVGVYGRLLARHGAKVKGIELDPHAADAAAHRSPPGFEVAVGRVEDLLARALPADCVITNPPRQGMAEQAIGALCAQPPDRVVYVSCDPATLARDLARMAEHFEVSRVQAVDLFPQTAHVETLVTAISRSAKDQEP